MVVNANCVCNGNVSLPQKGKSLRGFRGVAFGSGPIHWILFSILCNVLKRHALITLPDVQTDTPYCVAQTNKELYSYRSVDRPACHRSQGAHPNVRAAAQKLENRNDSEILQFDDGSPA